MGELLDPQQIRTRSFIALALQIKYWFDWFDGKSFKLEGFFGTRWFFDGKKQC